MQQLPVVANVTRPRMQAALTRALGVALWALAGGIVSDPARSQPPPTPPPAWSTETRQPGSAEAVAVQVSALLTDDGQSIDQGLVWHVFRDSADPAVKPRLVTQSRDAAPRFRLEPGEYLINAAFGRANLTRRFTVLPGKPMNERFVLNAGGLKITATLPGSDPAAERAVTYDVFSEERDQAGHRVRIVSAARPGRIVRLNAGLYQVISTYGDANARVMTEITVEPES